MFVFLFTTMICLQIKKSLQCLYFCLQRGLFVTSFEDINNSNNLDIPDWKFGRFDLERYKNDECLANFRFYKNDTISQML